LVDKFHLTPYEINTGHCIDFANETFYMARDFGIKTEIRFNDRAGHSWIEYEGKHYDAEAPKGISNWRNLAAIKRGRQAS
jgi:hypothetical protein